MQEPLSQYTEMPVRRIHSTGGFEVGEFRRRAGVVRDKCILLVDDVMTTGSTAAACALALKRAGASRVVLLTVARVDRRFEDTRAVADHADVEVPF